MQRPRTIRTRLLAPRSLVSAAIFVLLCSAGVPAHAVSKEIVELQTQVQQLLDMVQRLQSTLDQRFTAIQGLAQQTADAAAKTTAAMNDLQQKLNTQNDALNGKLDTSSGQVQSLNDSVDELKSRIAKLDKTVQDLQTQLQNMQQPPPGSLPAGGVAPGGDASQPGGTQQPGAMQPAQMPAPVPAAPAAAQAPPLQETYEAGLRDYNAARYPLAAQELGDVVHYYPLDDLAGTAQF